MLCCVHERRRFSPALLSDDDDDDDATPLPYSSSFDLCSWFNNQRWE